MRNAAEMLTEINAAVKAAANDVEQAAWMVRFARTDSEWVANLGELNAALFAAIEKHAQAVRAAAQAGRDMTLGMTADDAAQVALDAAAAVL